MNIELIEKDKALSESKEEKALLEVKLLDSKHEHMALKQRVLGTLTRDEQLRLQNDSDGATVAFEMNQLRGPLTYLKRRQGAVGNSFVSLDLSPKRSLASKASN